MNGELKHYGVLGMKWGVRRTPEQLGHKKGNAKTASAKGKTKAKSSKPGTKRTSEMTDDELMQRIKRLDMEERYDNLVARQRQRNTSSVKKIMGDALERLGSGVANKLVEVAINKMFEKKDNFNIRRYENMNLKDMDMETVQKVSKWYAQAQAIEKSRASLNKDNAKDGQKDKDNSKDQNG